MTDTRPPRPSRRASWMMLLLCLAAGCQCDEAIAALNPAIDVDPGLLDFGPCVVGTPYTKTLQIGNRGEAPLDATLSIEDEALGFALSNTTVRVRPGLAETIEVTFTSLSEAAVATDVIVHHNDPTHHDVRVALMGTGGPPLLLADPGLLDFGVVNENDDATRAVTVTNTGLNRATGLTLSFVHGGRFSAAFDADSDVEQAGLAAQTNTVVTVTLNATEALDQLAEDDGLIHDVLRIGSDRGSVDVAIQARINLAPVAILVEDSTRLADFRTGVGKPWTLDASDTFDPDGDAFYLSYALVTRPADSLTSLIPIDDLHVRLVPDAVGPYVVVMRATDTFGAFDEATVTLSPRELVALLRWQTASDAACQAQTQSMCEALSVADRQQVCCGQSDLDLHLLAPGGSLGDVGACPETCTDAQCTEFTDASAGTCRQTGTDCGFSNRAPEWGEPGRADDPRLDVDDVRGSGPEIISLDTPQDGTYRALVHYCTDRIGEPSLATVDIYLNGVLTHSVGPERVEIGDAWTATTILRDAGDYTFVSPPGVIDHRPDLCGPALQ